MADNRDVVEAIQQLTAVVEPIAAAARDVSAERKAGAGPAGGGTSTESTKKKGGGGPPGGGGSIRTLGGNFLASATDSGQDIGSASVNAALGVARSALGDDITSTLANIAGVSTRFQATQDAASSTREFFSGLSAAGIRYDDEQVRSYYQTELEVQKDRQAGLEQVNRVIGGEVGQATLDAFNEALENGVKNLKAFARSLDPRRSGGMFDDWG